MMPRNIFVPESDEVTGDCRRQHNERLMICIAHRILIGLSDQEDEIGGIM